ncbi:MAG: ribose-phosphate pyrophosphokinase-like domain-containing protein, partial [Henriciella sp.]
MTDPMIAVLPGADAFAEALGLPVIEMKFDAFPDGESYVRCLSDVAGREVAVLAQLNDPDPQIMRLILAARTLASLGAKRVGLVAPYLPYLRQDAVFNSGESVSAQHFGALVSSVFDWVVTVDPHLHRLSSLSDVLTVPSTAVSSAEPVAAWIRANVEAPLLIGPDMESEQWLEMLSGKLGGVPFH